ncbi:MAG: alginate lyase family protein [Sphingomonadales bacterium]
MKENVRQVLGRHFGRRSASAGNIEPDFSLAQLVAALSREYPLIDQAAAAVARGDEDQAKDCLVRHFSERQAPKFFFDSATPPDAATVIAAEYPAWKEGVLSRAEQMLTRGAPVYADVAAPLSGAFDWSQTVQKSRRDLLYQVRLNRFAFAPVIALAQLHGADTRNRLRQILDGWIGAVGSDAYQSNLVVINRIIALTWTLALLAGVRAGEPGLEITILSIIGADAHFLADGAGRSAPNNHLLADGFGLWFVAILFPEFLGADQWREKGGEIWLREFKRQIYPDGASFEHSVHYHELACEMAAGYVLLSRANDVEPPEWAVDRLERMLAFQMALAPPGGRPPAIGDSAEDPLFPLDAEQGWGSGAWREIYRALFAPATTPAPVSDPTVERGFWLLGGRLAGTASETAPGPGFRDFPDGGFTVFCQHDGRDRLVFRTGPSPRMTSFVGHLHADLLSVYLMVNAKPVIGEAGTFSYRSQKPGNPDAGPDWRGHYMGPAAHNGLTIEGCDPLGERTGDFRDGVLGSTVRRNATETGSGLAWVEGENIGDTAYAGHRRGVIHVVGHYWLIYDLLPEGTREQTAVLGLQLAPDCEASANAAGSVYVSRRGRGILRIATDGLSTARISKGAVDPVAGWVSTAYGAHDPAPMLRFGFKDGVRCAATLLLPGGEEMGARCQVEVLPREQAGLLFKIRHGDFEELVAANPAKSGVVVDQLTFDGAILWLRKRDGRPVATRQVGGDLLSWPDI